MTESQRIVLNWKARLKEIGWPEDSIKTAVKELCEAGYLQCIEDLKARAARNKALLERVAQN